MKLTYRKVLEQTQKQAINLLSGRYLGTNGRPPNAKVRLCYGCTYSELIHVLSRRCPQPRKAGVCQHVRPQVLAERMRIEDCRNIDTNDPKMLIKAVLTIDKMLYG